MILDQIAEKKKERIEARKKVMPLEIIKEEAIKCSTVTTRNAIFYNALINEGLSIIGEIKYASPSTGQLKTTLNLEESVTQYEASVEAFSVLTEEDYFNGSIDLFETVRRKSKKPMLRKDFIIEAYQIYESKVIGADCILLIAALLDKQTLKSFYDLAQSLHLDVLLEVHNESELEQALEVNPEIIGINNRNLKDFTIDLNTTKELRPMIPKNKRVISESGILTKNDIQFIKDCKVDGILVGRALMEHPNPKNIVKEWKMVYGT